MSARALKFGLRKFMASTGELLIPFADIRASVDYLPTLRSDVVEAHLDLNRMISDQINQRLGEGRRG